MNQLNRFYKITHSMGLFALAAMSAKATLDLDWPMPINLALSICFFVIAGSAVGYLWENERKGDK